MKCTLWLLISFFYVLSLDAQVTGTVFRDFNANGTKDNTALTDEVGTSGVVVNAYNPSGVALSVSYTGGGTSTNSTGGYSVTGGTLGQIRLEFVMPDNFTFASNGSAGGTSVLFPTSDTQNLGVNYPADYCEGDLQVIVPCFVFGAPTLFPNSETAISDPFSTRFNTLSGPVTHAKKWAQQSQTGAVYGSAYNRTTKKNYLAAYYKRYSGFGPGNGNSAGSTGAIYETDDAGNVTVLIDLPASETGANPHPNTVDFQKDPSWWEVGKVSWGDMDISDDSKTLYAMNLFNRKLYEIDIATKTVTNSTFIPGITGGAAFIGPTADNNTDLRPFGVKYYKGKVYVGVVCTAESEFSTSPFDGKNPNLQGFVFTFTPGVGFSATPVTNFQLSGDNTVYTYLKNIPFQEFGYQMWYPESRFLTQDASNWNNLPLYFTRPIISDIDFINDDMVIGIRDISKDLAANQEGTFFPDGVTAAPGGFGSTGSNGLVLKACKNGTGGFTIENNGQCGGITGANTNNFYLQFIAHPTGDHMGGIGVLPGKQTIVANTQPGANAGATAFISESTKTFDLATGINIVYNYDFGTTNQNPLFGKANGLGDIEITCSIQPIEIGNRVWADTDGDGIQDAGEAPIAGVTVQLIQGTTVIATATTDGNGNYYFSSATGTTTASAIYGITQLEPNMSYIVRIPNVQGGSKQAALGVNNLTTANVGGAGQPDVRDSDGTLVGNNADVTVMTTDIPTAGANNHNFDFGFSMVACVTPTATAASTNPTCSGSTGQSNGTITISGFTSGQRYQYSTGATFSGTATPASITAIPVGGVIVNNLANTTQQYTVRIYDATDNTCFVDRVVSITAAVCGDCNCTDMIYLNDETGDVVHKFSLDATSGSLSEIGSPWLDNPPGINNPHGIAIDLNGFVYIASAGNPIVNPPWDSHFNGGKVFKLQADGTMINPNPDPTAVNFTEWNANWGTENGILYVPNAVDETVDAYELCSGTYIGSMFAVNNGGDVQTWGFYVENGKWYWPNQSDGGVFTGSTDLNLYTLPATNSGVVLFNHGINPDIFLSATPLGMTRDAAGNFYIIRGAIGGGAAEIRKYNPTGTFITSVSDNSGSANATNGLPGFYGARGIAYSKMTNKLYVGSFENCVSVFDTDLVQQTALNIGNPTNGRPKGIGILTECCPTVANETIDKVVCSNGNGEKVFLQNLLDCGEGTIGEGNWVEVTNTSGGNIEFNECDLSITVNGSGCATYTLSKISPSGGNQQCGPFSITLNICTEVPSATVAGAQGTCTGANPNNDVLINITSTMNADEAGISTGATYTGPAYGNAANIDISGGFGSFTGRMHNTQYTVRIFNGSNDCYVDYVVTTPTIVCCALTVVCTPQPQTNCSPINGSASVVASNAVGTVTYLWSSGETTSTISNKAAATYTVTVTDGGVAGCSRTCEAIIANNASAPTCAITANSQPSCANLTGGSITVVPSPAGTYTYAWSDNGAATATRSGLTGGTYTVTVTNTTSNCTGVCNVTLTTPTNCCNISAITAINLECIDNGTPALITDNRIRFSANVTNTNISLTGYNVTINGGTTITPNANVPYGVTQFTLGAGTAGGGATFTVTVTDSATPGCTRTFQVVDPGNCTPVIPECPPVQCGTATIQVNGN